MTPTIQHLSTSSLQWLTRVGDFTQVALQFPQLPSPFTTIFTVCAQHIKLCQGALQALISKQFEVIFPACRTGFVLSLESFTTCVAEVGTATFRLVWVSEYQAAYQTFCPKCTRRGFDKLAVISSKRLLLWPAVRLCPSLSSQWCVGGWSFLLLRKRELVNLCDVKHVLHNWQQSPWFVGAWVHSLVRMTYPKSRLLTHHFYQPLSYQ